MSGYHTRGMDRRVGSILKLLVMSAGELLQGFDISQHLD